MYTLYFGSFEMWCWRRMVKISWTDRVKNEEVLHRKEEKEGNTHNKSKEGYLQWPHLAYEITTEHVTEGNIEEE